MTFFQVLKRFFLGTGKAENPAPKAGKPSKLDPRFFSLMGGGKGPLMRKRRKYGNN